MSPPPNLVHCALSVLVKAESLFWWTGETLCLTWAVTLQHNIGGWSNQPNFFRHD